ncbi:uncharacterized protein LOC62_03G004985 [Vanrija pseudolonga]|uniref:Uncharacterized protein n=1 Tax=Vanrija pseudolonga TaxID=143232 RepID=A0AAF1BQY0_9TREE|nr:hypothetical protein LOC62_03G004985 [Vanrija pseudolonga]
MSLSVGTLNLKFMQRAAAAKARDESVAAGGSPAPAPAAPPPLPKGTDQAEEDAKWFLPSRRAAPAVPASTSTAGAGPSRPRVNFVASYLPFVADEAPGRRAFGGFGDKPKEEDEEAEDSDEEGVDSDGEVVEVKKAKGKRRDDTTPQPAPPRRAPAQATPEPEDAAPARFVRPAGFDSPSKPKGKNKAAPAPPKQSQADKLRATISSMKGVSVSGVKRAAGDAEGSSKRSKVSSGPGSPAPSASSKASSGSKGAAGGAKPKSKSTGGKPAPALSLDEREKQIKAAKKAAKRAAKA